MTGRATARGRVALAVARVLGAATSMLATVVIAWLVFDVAPSRPLHLGLGFSTQFQQSVATLVAGHVGPTLLLMGSAVAVAEIVGALMGRVRSRRLRAGAQGAATVLWSAPAFWIALGLLVALGVGTGGSPAVFPAGGLITPGVSSQAVPRVIDVLWHLALPCLTLALGLLGQSATFARSTPRFARIGAAVSATVAVEVVFSWPGLGDLAYQALQTPDIPVLEGTFLTLAAITIAADLLAPIAERVLGRVTAARSVTAGRVGAGSPPVPGAVPDPAPPSGLAASRVDRVREFLRTPGGFAGMTILVLVVSWTLAAPLFVHPSQLDLLRDGAPILHAPTLAQPFGTDETGRGELALVLWGGRSSLAVAALAAAAAVGLGGVIGAGGRCWPSVAGRPAAVVTEWFAGVGTLPLAIALAAIIGPGETALAVAVAVTSWAPAARLVRTRVPREPIGLLVACMALVLADALVCETTLAFLGLGEPFRISWGAILNQAFVYGDVTSGAWWTLVAPGAAIFVTVLALRLSGRAAEGLLTAGASRPEPTSCG